MELFLFLLFIRSQTHKRSDKNQRTNKNRWKARWTRAWLVYVISENNTRSEEAKELFSADSSRGTTPEYWRARATCFCARALCSSSGSREWPPSPPLFLYRLLLFLLGKRRARKRAPHHQTPIMICLRSHSLSLEVLLYMLTFRCLDDEN